MKLSDRLLSVVLATVLVMSLTVVTVKTAYADPTDSADACSIYYTGNYYDAIGGLEDLIGRSDTSTVITDLRALIGYTSVTTTVSNGKTVKGTDAKHPSYTGTGSSSLAGVFKKSERLADDTHDGMRLFYTNDYVTTSCWNREHVWPQSKSGGLYGKTGGGNDLHHLRPAYNDDNSRHGSYPYGYVENGTPYYCNNKSSSYVIAYIANDYTMEVVDEYKGDIARIFAYMVTHYASLYNLIDKVLIGGYDTLVKWNEVDPVDGYELNRNEVAYQFQGNRNPFIDCPDLIDVIWGDGINHDDDTDTEYYTDTETSSDIQTDSESNYLTLKEANEQNVGSNITVRGQVTYIYGGSTVILEEVDESGMINRFQIYDQAGVINGKYPLNTVVEVKGEVSEYNGLLQIKLPDRIVQISGHNTPIPAVECDFDDLWENTGKLVVLREMKLGEYDYWGTTMTDKYGNTVNCFKPADYPEGIEAGDVVDICCSPYVFEGEVQIRIANSYDYSFRYTDRTVEPDEPVEMDIEEDDDDDRCGDSDTSKNVSEKSAVLGDTDCNGILDMEDVVETQKYIADLVDDIDGIGLRNADMDHNGEITLVDVVFMQRVIAKLE